MAQMVVITPFHIYFRLPSKLKSTYSSILLTFLFGELQGKYTEPPTIFTTAVHYRSSLMHDATSVWLEDVSTTSFKICLRELQNFAGVHDDISVVS